MISTFFTLCLLIASCLSFPQLPPGVDPVSCPNYPFCGETPAPIATAANQNTVCKASMILISNKAMNLQAALQAHAAAEAAVKAQQAQGPGLVGPSGNIGPSGLCGASGCVAFGK